MTDKNADVCNGCGRRRDDHSNVRHPFVARKEHLPRKREPIWCDTTCSAEIPDNRPQMHGNGNTLVCGMRQFKTASGDTCADGHGGADGVKMEPSEIATWERLRADGDLADQVPHDEMLKDWRPLSIDPLGPGDLKLGDIVKLRSGGPSMTVTRIVDEQSRVNGLQSNTQIIKTQMIDCIWFNSLNSVAIHTFDIRLLCSGD